MTNKQCREMKMLLNHLSGYLLSYHSTDGVHFVPVFTMSFKEVTQFMYHAQEEVC